MGGEAAQSCWLLLTLSLTGIFAGDWSVHLPSGPICATIGSSVVLPCSYDYPRSANESRGVGQLLSQGGEAEEQQYKVSSEMWCLKDSRCVTPRYVFHSAGIFPDPSYQSRVQYLGQPGTNNCSLRISNLRKSDSGNYVFYLITSHPTQKMPAQRGVQLLVADSSGAVTASANPSSGITEGVAVHLACCSPLAGPQAHFRWFKSHDASPRHNGQVWNISEVTSDDSGSYYCQIQTGEEVQNSTMLGIDVEYPPRHTTVSVHPAGELLMEFPVTLTCKSDANPPVSTYTWYQGAACFSTTDKSFHQVKQSLAALTGGSTLSSANITAEEDGQHCCIARNRHGSQTYTVTLTDYKSRNLSESTGSRKVFIGVSMGVLVLIIAVVAFLVIRSQKSSHRHSYVLSSTAPTDP